MSEKLLVPDIGDLKKLKLLKFLVKQGDQIKLNDPVVTIESDKSSVEIPSTFLERLKSVKLKLEIKFQKEIYFKYCFFRSEISKKEIQFQKILKVLLNKQKQF